MVAKTARKEKTSKTIKQELLNSLKEIDSLEKPDIDATADTIRNSFKAIRLIQHYKKIIKTEKNRALSYVGKQGLLLKKFRKTKQFLQNVGQKR